MTATSPPIDINPTHLETIQRILNEHVPDCEVRAFGSRAKWNAEDYSDLDLAVVGEQPLDWRVLNKLKDTLEESTLPFRVDVLDWHDISENFKEMIKAECILLEKNASLDNGKEMTLGEFTPFNYGKGLKDAHRNSTGNVPVYGSNGIVGWHDEALTNGPTIIIGRKGTVGAVHYSPIPCWPIDTTFFVTGQDPELVRFQYYALKALKLDGMNSDSAVPGLNRDAAHARRMRIPSLSKQRDIAHILGTLDDKIELNRRMNETLEAMAQALFKSWFVDFDPVRAKMEGRWRPGESLPGLPAHLYDLFPNSLVSSKLGKIPEGWKTGVLDDAIEILSGGTPSTVVDQYWDGEIPWYTAKDAPNLSDIFVVKTERTITPLGVQNCPTRILPAGTTIISARGSVGKLALLDTPMAFNQTCYGIRNRNRNLDLFTYWVIRTLTEQIGGKAHGTIFDTITRQTFKLIDFIYPSTNSIIEFQSLVQSLMTDVLSNLKELASLTSLRNALLSELTSGKLRRIRE